ncbi:MAG: Fur family transcriptional regulator, partial [Anaerolineae bacterium]
LLAELGLVRRIHRENGCHSYAMRNARHGHHLVCSSCGRAVEFADCNLQPLVEALQARTGFRIEGHILELTGRCPSCLAE